MNLEDLPLTNAFYENPLEYFQNHVRNLNNEVFLSEYHINSLYALLLIGRNSPWDLVKGNNPRVKEDIDLILNQKVHEVKIILQNLSNMYEDKSKKSAISQIQKLMGILKSKRKSIFIEKDRSSESFQKFQTLAKMAQQLEKGESHRKQQVREKTQEKKGEERSEQPVAFIRQNSTEGNELELVPKQELNSLLQANQKSVDKTENQEIAKVQQPQRQQTQKSACVLCTHKAQIKEEEKGENREELKAEATVQLNMNGSQSSPSSKYQSGKEVFSIFYGLSNMSNLTAMALTNIVEYNSTERFIKFKMSQSYIMTIKSEDPFHFDTASQLKKVPSELFVNHVFPFLTASELFQCRSVCKQWLEFVKQSWHSTFKREMFVQLLACQFCKDIQFYYKTIQLRNPFFQKLSLLIHALIEIINWQIVTNLISSNTLSLQLKKVLLILLRLVGQPIPLTNLNALNDAFYDQHKSKLANLKQKVSQFFSTLSGSDLSINDLRVLKTGFLDDPYMRVEDVGADDKTPLLLNLLIKQVTLQQILRNHIYLAQQYLLNTKKRLDNISKKMVCQKGYLEGVYKILLLKSTQPFSSEAETNQLPNFNEMLQSIFSNRNCQRPDFVLRSKNSSTEIYLDNATKLDIILSTVYNINEREKSASASATEPQQQQRTQEQVRSKKQKNLIVNSVDLKIECGQQTESIKQQALQAEANAVSQQGNECKKETSKKEQSK